MSKDAIKKLNKKNIHSFVEHLAAEQMHAKRIQSLSSGVVGVVHAATLAVSAIGRALAQVEGLNPKHAIKQVDRLLSNGRLQPWDFFALWVPHLLGARKEIVVAIDWTDFDKDGHSTVAIHLITRHGRATPLLWKTVEKGNLRGWRNAHEDAVLMRLKEVLPAGVKVTVLADRGFGDSKLYALLWELEFDYIIRFRGEITVTDKNGESKAARDWLSPSGRARQISDAEVTKQRVPIPAVVCVHAKGMKEPWFLACGSKHGTATRSVKLYGRRFTIEEGFRDSKDLRFGMGLAATHIASVERRDRVLLLNALAVVLLTLLGAAGENTGLDRRLRANTVKRRTHSLFFQGNYYYGAIPNMKRDQLEPLLAEFSRLLGEQPVFDEIFGWV